MDDLNISINLGKIINSYLSLVFKIGLIIVILSTFFLFANLTTEFYDTPKLLVLLIFTGAMLVLLALKYTLSGKVVFIRTSLDIPLLLLLAVAAVSTFLSPSPYVSLLGSQLKVHGSLISLIAYVLLYFVLVNSLKNARGIKWIFTLATSAAQILAATTLLSYAGLKVLPLPFTYAANFTPAGSSFSTTAILALLIPVIVMQILTSTKPLSIILNSLFLALSGITIALTGTWATWIGALVGLGLSVFAAFGFSIPVWKLKDKPGLYGLIGLIIPLVLIAVVTTISFIPPFGGYQNPLYNAAKNFPREIQLPFVTSWKISVSAFRDLPFWGTGPATYSFDFTNYKPIEFNSSKAWNLRFDQPFNEYMQVLATLGGVGILAMLSLTALFISSAFSVIARHSSVILSETKDINYTLHSVQGDKNTLRNDREKLALAISGLVFFIILALHASTLPVWIIGILILASFMAAGLSSGENNPGLFSFKPGLNEDFKSMFLRIATNITSYDPSRETIKVDALPGVLLTFSLAAVVVAGFFGGKIVLADYHHRLALNAVSQNQGIIAYNELIASEKLNPKNDLYRTDLAQINFALANAIALAKGPTEASPTGSLTDQDKQNIQVLLQQSINEGRIATTLSPKSSINWEVLALLYRQIAGVAQNALIFSLDSYGRAIFQDPLNPQLRINVGGVYYAVKNYDLAIRFFTDAVNLKPDFANGYYNLSVALRDKGDLNGAKTTAEKVLTLVDSASADYKTVSGYLADLNNKIASGPSAKEEPPIQPPAATASGALQEKGLPKVINLPKLEKIATPTAIKKPVTSPAPNPTPSETPSPAATP